MIVNILTGIAIIIALVLIAALLVKKEYGIHREIIINKPVKEVFDYMKYLKNQEKYSKWVMADPDMKKDLRGIDGTAGCVYSWNGNNKAGEGEQEITGLTENKKIDIEIRFVRPFKGIASTPIITDAISSDQTKVTWGMNGIQKYPMNLMTMFMKGMLEKDLDTSLHNLKTILEK